MFFFSLSWNKNEIEKCSPQPDVIAACFYWVSSSWPSESVWKRFSHYAHCTHTISFKLSISIHFLLASIACNVCTTISVQLVVKTIEYKWSHLLHSDQITILYHIHFRLFVVVVQAMFRSGGPNENTYRNALSLNRFGHCCNAIVIVHFNYILWFGFDDEWF